MGGVILSTSISLAEPIYGISEGNRLCFSNSIAFLLAYTGHELDKNYPRYEEDLLSTLYGVEDYKRSVPLKKGSIEIYACANISVDSHLSINVERRHSGLRFASFEDYRRQVADIVKQVVGNAQDKGRKSHYGMISTVSRGYDATCSSVLAHEAGCNECFTFAGPGKYVKDNGAELARTLGYETVHEVDAMKYKLDDSLLDVDTFALGSSSGAQFNAFQNLYHDKILFMGDRGDSVWNKNNPNVNNLLDFRWGNMLMEECHNAENMLRNNTILLCVPLIGADAWTDLHTISNSKEMEAWSIGGGYDRPIPRRIIEEAGIERHQFGRGKMGGGISYHLNTFRSLTSKMSPHSFEALKAYRKQLKRNPWKRRAYAAKFYWHMRGAYLNYAARKLKVSIKFKRPKSDMSSPLSSLLILWGMDVLTKRYQQAMQ